MPFSFHFAEWVTLAQKLKILDFFLLEFKRNSCMNFGNKKNVVYMGEKNQNISLF